jgi:hypothetical protein
MQLEAGGWRQQVSPKLLFSFGSLYFVLSQTAEVFITAGEGASGGRVSRVQLWQTFSTIAA